MDTFDSQGKVSPVGAADQGIVSKKITGKDGQGDGTRQQLRQKSASVQVPEETEDTQTEKHVIDIIV
jgi:hypothetical protein